MVVAVLHEGAVQLEQAQSLRLLLHFLPDVLHGAQRLPLHLQLLLLELQLALLHLRQVAHLLGSVQYARSCRQRAGCHRARRAHSGPFDHGQVVWR